MQQILTDSSNQQALRRELGAFLRARREQAHPEMYGIAPHGRRRAKGLRREELAQLVDVGITWYTWLEQGRDIHPSAALLQRLADALGLGDHDRRHLFELSRPVREVATEHDTPTEAVLQGVVQSFTAGPAYVRNARYDLLAFNDAMGDFYGIERGATGLARNLLWLTFTDPRARTINANWDAAAGIMLGGFRSAYGKHRNEASFQELIGALEAASPIFAERWKRYDVWKQTSHRLRVAWVPASSRELPPSPGDGSPPPAPLELNVSYFSLVGDDDRVLIVMTPRTTATEA